MVAAGYLASHLMTQHGRVAEKQRSWRTPAGGGGPRTFQMVFPAKGGLRSCPVEGCLGRAATRTAMRVHFLQRQFLDTVFIMEEGNLPHPRYARCNMLVPWQALNGKHPTQLSVPGERIGRGGGSQRRR